MSVETELLEKYSMFNKTYKMKCSRVAGAFAIAIGVALVLAGCKETTSKPSPNGAADSKGTQEKVQTPPESPSKGENPTAKVENPTAKVENPTVDESVQPPAASPAQSKKNLIDVIRGARYWEVVREFVPLIGQDAPDFTLTDINGKVYKLSDYKGKDVIIKLWATWCPPCKRTVPHLMELRKTVGEDKLMIMAMSYVSSYPPNTEEMIKEFASAKEINYPVFAVGSEGIAKVYDSAGSLPTIFFIDPKGKIKLATTGLMPLEDIKAVLEAQWPEGAI